MANYLVLSITRAVAGRQDDMLRWYDTRHLRDILAIDGFSNPRRYRMADIQVVPGEPEDQFVTLFDLASDNLNDVVTATQSRIASGQMEVSDAVEEFRVCVLSPIEAQSRRS